MADRTFLLGIDVSTTGAKALLIAATGEVVASASTPLTVSTPHPLWSEQAPADWWDGVVTSILRVLAESGVETGAIAAIGLTGRSRAGASDENGECCAPPSCGTTSVQARSATDPRASGAQRLIRITGNAR